MVSYCRSGTNRPGGILIEGFQFSKDNFAAPVYPDDNSSDKMEIDVYGEVVKRDDMDITIPSHGSFDYDGSTNSSPIGAIWVWC